MEQDGESQVTRTVKVLLGSGVEIGVEASVLPNQEGEVASFREILSLAGISAAIRELAVNLKSALDEVAPTKASLEFGLQIGVEPGKLAAIWVQGEAKANVKIKLEWAGKEGKDGTKA